MPCATCLYLAYFTECDGESLGSSLMLQTALFHSSLWLNNIPLYVCTTSSSPTRLAPGQGLRALGLRAVRETVSVEEGIRQGGQWCGARLRAGLVAGAVWLEKWKGYLGRQADLGGRKEGPALIGWLEKPFGSLSNHSNKLLEKQTSEMVWRPPL